MRSGLLQHASGGHELCLEYFSLFHLSVVDVSVTVCYFCLSNNRLTLANRNRTPFWTLPGTVSRNQMYRHSFCIFTWGTSLKFFNSWFLNNSFFRFCFLFPFPKIKSQAKSSPFDLSSGLFPLSLQSQQCSEKSDKHLLKPQSSWLIVPWVQFLQLLVTAGKLN